MVAEPDSYIAFCACDTVIVVVPVVSMVTTLPAIVATFVFEDVYENATGLLELGSTNTNDASMTLVFVIDGKLVMITVNNGEFNPIPLEYIPSPPYKV